MIFWPQLDEGGGEEDGMIKKIYIYRERTTGNNIQTLSKTGIN